MTGKREQAQRARAEIRDLVPRLTPRQLGYWVEKGWIVPAERRVQGHPQTFSADERRVLAAMARLVQSGFPAALAAQVARKALRIAQAAGDDHRNPVHVPVGYVYVVLDI